MATNRTFADRSYRPEEGDGYDFERFVFEALSRSDAETGLVRRLGRGRDGAIDIVAENDGRTAIFECKYVGDLKFETVRARWREVQSNLVKYLPTLAAEPKKSPKSPYRFWLDAERPVRSYEFCVTAPLSNLEARELMKEIQANFAELAARPGLDVLSSLGSDPDAVTVKSWDDFEGMLGANPALAYRWFGGLPYGRNCSTYKRCFRKAFISFFVIRLCLISGALTSCGRQTAAALLVRISSTHHSKGTSSQQR